MESNVTLLVDSREKRPLVFPRNLRVLDPSVPPARRKTRLVEIRTARQTLEVGDYLLSSAPDRTVVERKGSLSECATNCLTSKDRGRFVRALDRLAGACSHPILMLEGTPGAMLRGTMSVDVEPGIALDALIRCVRERRIELLFLPSGSLSARRAAGEVVARLLLNGALTHGPPAHV